MPPFGGSCACVNSYLNETVSGSAGGMLLYRGIRPEMYGGTVRGHSAIQASGATEQTHRHLTATRPQKPTIRHILTNEGLITPQPNKTPSATAKRGPTHFTLNEQDRTPNPAGAERRKSPRRFRPGDFQLRRMWDLNPRGYCYPHAFQACDIGR